MSKGLGAALTTKSRRVEHTDYGAIVSRVMRRAWELRHEYGIDYLKMGEAITMARAEVAREMGIPEDVLTKELAKRSRGMKGAHKPVERKPGTTAAEIYRGWADTMDETPSDDDASRLAGYSSSNMARARAILTKDGYVFQAKYKGGPWLVIARHGEPVNRAPKEIPCSDTVHDTNIWSLVEIREALDYVNGEARVVLEAILNGDRQILETGRERRKLREERDSIAAQIAALTARLDELSAQIK